MNKNVTYLFGAGASANSLPVVSNLRERISSLIELLNELKSNLNVFYGINKMLSLSDLGDEAIYTIENFQIELQWLLQESENHLTVDTLAKKYFHTNAGSLIRLKKALIAFFTFEQITDLTTTFEYYEAFSSTHEVYPEDDNRDEFKDFKKRDFIDKRYDSFIAAHLKNEPEKLSFKENFKIVTWNYDMQIELVFKTYSEENIFYIQDKLQVVPRRKTENLSPNKDDGYDKSNIAVIKLNGSAFCDYLAIENSHWFVYDKVEGKEIPEKIKIFLEYYKEIFMLDGRSDKVVRLFNFDWEKENKKLLYGGYNYTQGCAVLAFQSADVLVIIGYSFPFFNKETDDNLMNFFTGKTHGKKIYIQDLNAEEIKEILLSRYTYLNEEDIIPIKYVSSFFIPHEI